MLAVLLARSYCTWGQESEERRLQGTRYFGLCERHVELTAAGVESEQRISVDGCEEHEADIAHVESEYFAAVEGRGLRLVQRRRLKMVLIDQHTDLLRSKVGGYSVKVNQSEVILTT